MSPLTIQYREGSVYLPAFGLWLDARKAQRGPDRVFVSHAHSDHTGAHREVILTEVTSLLMQTRIKGKRLEHLLPFGEPRAFQSDAEAFDVTLLPAGHILGSAMALIEHRGQSLLYTGDFRLRSSRPAERCEPQHADILIMETTFGRPEYRFPSPAAVLADMIDFCRQAFAHEETPVLLGYSVGKSQELLWGLADTGWPIMLHESVWKITDMLAQSGLRWPACELWNEATARGKVLLCPPQAARSGCFERLGRVRRAIVTGWAVDPGCRFRYGADAAFPLSDHADFADLIEMVKQVRPKKVFTLHGFAADFAQTLRELGFDAEALSQSEQLLLPLGRISDQV